MSSSTSGSPTFELGAGPLQDAKDARVDRTRQRALDLGDDHAGGGDHGLDRTGRDGSNAQSRAGNRRTQPAWKPGDEERDNEKRERDLDHPAAAVMAQNFFGEGAIHACPVVQGACRCGRWEPTTYACFEAALVRERTKRCSEADSSPDARRSWPPRAADV